MASTTTHLIELIINATNNAGAGFAAARRDAQKFNDLINQGEKDTDRSAEAQDRLQKAIEVSNKKMKEENDSLGENIELTEKDAAAKADLTRAIKDQAAELASGEATKDSLFLADQRRDEAEDALAESRRKRRATEIRGEEAFVAKFGELGSRKKIQALKADSETAAIEVFALRRRRDIRNVEINAERQHVTTLNDLVKKAESGNFRGPNGARTKFQQLRPALNEAGFTNIDVSGSDQTFLRTLRNARKAATGRVTRAKTGTLPGLAEDTSQDAIDAAIGKRLREQRKTDADLKRAVESRTRDTVAEARFIDEIIAKEEERAALEIDRFAMEQEHQALIIEGEKERNKALLEGESILNEREKKEAARQAARRKRATEDRKAGLDVQRSIRDEERENERGRKTTLAEIEKISKASRENGRLSSEENIQAMKQIRQLRQEYVGFGGDAKDAYAVIMSASKSAGEEQLEIGEELAKQEEKRILDAENTYKKASEIRERSRRLASDRSKLRTEGQEDDLALKAKLEVDRLEINKLKEELRAELGDLEIKVEANPDAISIAKIEAIKAILGKDINVDIEFDEKISPLKFAAEAFGAFSDGAERASRSISSFDNVFRGLLVLGIVAFLGQLATGIILAASALTALVSSALSAAGALGGALVAGIGQALPAVGVLAAFGNRVSNVFDALKQSNLEQQQASYSGAEAADTQAKSLSGVADAQKALTEARKTAKKALEDLIFAEKGQALSVEEAGIALNKAVSSGGSLAVSRAQLGVEGANRDLAGTRSEISSRKKGGIEGSPEVVASQKSLDQALQSANQGTASVGAAAGKLNYLVENLSKAEQRLLKALIRLQTAWRKFAENITEPLTNSFTFAVNRVVKILDSKEILNAGKRLSKALGDSFTQIFDFVFSKNTVTRFLALGEEFAKNLKPITSIAISLLNIFLNFAEAGGPALSLILGYLNDIVGALDRWSSSIAGKKSLTDFFTEGSGSLKGILDLLMAIGNVILAIMGPGGGIKAGNEIIQQMVDGLNKFAEAIKDPTSRVGIFFKNFFDQGKKLLPILGPIFSALGTLVEALISPRAIEAFENFSHIVANAVIPGIEKFIALSTLLFNVFSEFAKTGLGEFIIKWGIASALIGGVVSKVVAIAAPFTSLAGYLSKATGQLTLFNKELKITNALTAVSDLSGRGAAKNSLKKGKSVAVDAGPGSASAAEYGAALAANEAFDASKGVSQRRSQKAREKALGKLGVIAGVPSLEEDQDKARKQANKIDKIGDKAGLASAGSLLSKFASPAGLIAIAVAAIVAGVVLLLKYSGRLGDVWKAIKDTFSKVFDSIKESLAELAKEITGEKSIGKLFKDIGNFLADILIPYIKLFGVLIGVVVVTGIQRIISIVRFVKSVVKNVIQIFSGLKEFWDGVFSLDGEKILSGLGDVVSGILGIFGNLASLIFGILTAPFKALVSVVKSIFPEIGKGIESVFASVINFFIDGLNSVIGLIEKIPGVGDLDPIERVKTGEQKEQEAAKERKALYGSMPPRNARRDAQQNRDMRAARGDGEQPKASGTKRRTPKAATKVDNQDANSFLNTFDPQTVQLSDAIVKKLSSYWRALRRAARDSVNDVIEFLKDLRGAQGNGRVDKFVTLAISDFKRLRNGVRTNMVGISNIVQNQMQNASMAVYKGAKYMKETLNEALKSVGGKEVDLSIKIPKIKQAEEKASGGFVGRADGGWIGNRGERGVDAVPTMLGRGEAVLNWGQQKVVEPALRKVYGFGLDEMFGRTRGLHAGGANKGMMGLARGGRNGIYTASVYNDAQGYKSDNLASKPYNWAELGVNGGVGNAFGGLPYKTPIRVSYKGRSVNLKKLDIGSGGPGISGKVRAVDIWQTAANKLRLPGLANVYVSFNGGTGSSGTGGTPAQIAMPKIQGGSEAMRNIVSKGLEKFRKAANKKIERETPTDVTGGDISVPRGTASPNLRQAIAMAQSMGLTLSSFLRPNDLDSFHSQGRAADLAGSAAQMARFFRWALKRYGRRLTELFYDPLGAIDNGISIPSIGGHSDHVHIAFNRGGRVTEELIKSREKEARMKKRLGGLKKYAHGGMVNGKDGQEVPIVAHAGEWVVNKMQQAKLAMMAGTTPDRVKGALGFGGGPTSFAKGGEVKELNTTRLQGLAENIPAGINLFTTKISQAFNQAFSFVDKQINKTLGKVSSKNFSKNLETMLSSIRKLTGETGALDTIAGQITTFFEKATSSAKLLAAGFQAAGNKLKRVTTGEKFENAINPVKIAEAEAKLQVELQNRLLLLREEWVRTLARINKLIKKNKLGSKAQIQAQADKIQADIDKLEKDDESAEEKKKIKKLEKRLAENKKKLDARIKLDSERNQAQDKIKEIEDQIAEAEATRVEALKTAFAETTKFDTKTQDAAIKQSAYLKSVGELLSSFGGSLFGQTGQELITKSLADNKQAAIDRQTALNKRLEDAKKLAAADPRFQSLVDDLIEQVNESNIAVLETTAEEMAGKIAALQKSVEDKIKVIDTKAALENISKALGELTGDDGLVLGALKGSLENALAAQAALKIALDEALKQDQSDPRWKALTDDLKQKYEESGNAVAAGYADLVQNSITAAEKAFEGTSTTGEFIRGIKERGAALAERMGNRSGAFATRQENLVGRGADLQTQRNTLQALLDNPAIKVNEKQAEELRKKIAELDTTIAENTQETKDLSLEYRKSQVDLITGRSDRTTGLIGSVGGIIASIARATGSSQSLGSQVSLAQQVKAALGLEQGSIMDEIVTAISEQNLGSQGNELLGQLQAAFSSGDPNSFAATLADLAPAIANFESNLDNSTSPAAINTFKTLVDAMITNTTATTDNTANLAELNGLANQPQQFATTAWTKFRTALFNGVGDILPQFQIPQMATGGAITKGGLFQLHPGEFVVNATQSNLPSDSPINITVNEANKPLDVTALASRIAFEKRTRR